MRWRENLCIRFSKLDSREHVGIALKISFETRPDPSGLDERLGATGGSSGSSLRLQRAIMQQKQNIGRDPSGVGA
jgi:hypothetical protein